MILSLGLRQQCILLYREVQEVSHTKYDSGFDCITNAAACTDGKVTSLCRQKMRELELAVLNC